MFWLNGSFFGGVDRGLINKGVMTYLMAPTWPLNMPTFFHHRIDSLQPEIHTRNNESAHIGDTN
jgi:hypothetical protein